MSVDWVVIGAALVGLAVATIGSIQAATVNLADETSQGLTDQIVGAVAQATTTTSNTNN